MRFSGTLETNDETNNANEHKMVQNPIWQEVDQMTINERGRGVELGCTERQLRAGSPASSLAPHSATLPSNQAAVPI